MYKRAVFISLLLLRIFARVHDQSLFMGGSLLDKEAYQYLQSLTVPEETKKLKRDRTNFKCEKSSGLPMKGSASILAS